MTPAPGWLEPLLQRLAADAPATVLLLAPAAHPLAHTLRARLPESRLEHRSSGVQAGGERFEMAVVAGALEPLDAADAQALLAALRDRLAVRSVAWVDLDRCALDEAALRALGFRIHAHDGAQLLAGFDLYDYKDNPDWLNARHWAHPELWDRFRW